jgi:hypothetical protein
MAEHHAHWLLASEDEVAKFADPPLLAVKLLYRIPIPIRRPLPNLATSPHPLPLPLTISIDLVGDPVPLSF